MLQPTSETTLSRRLLLKISAVFCGLRLTGCSTNPQPQSIESPQSESPQEPTGDTPAAFVDRGYRLYGIVPEDDATFHVEVLPNIQPVAFPLATSQRNRHGELQPQPEFPWVIWASKSEADDVAKVPGVKAVIEKQPRHILVTGTPADANDALSVVFVPALGDGGRDDATYASLAQIVAAWRAEMRPFNGVEVIHSPRQDQPMNKIGDVPVEQVIIKFTTTELPAEVLTLIKQHPQTIHLKWNGLFTEFYCPPCGMG